MNAVTPPVVLPDRISGFRSEAINGIIDYLESLRPVASRSVWHEWMRSGVVSHARTDVGASAYPALFDLYAVTPTTVKVRGPNTITGQTACVCVGGVWLAISGSTLAFDTAITISAAAWLYLDITRATGGNTADLKSAASIPAGDDDQEKWVLWYVGWNGTASTIDATKILDYRNAPHITLMG